MQRQTYDPLVLVHRALASQPFQLELSHSLRSAEYQSKMSLQLILWGKTINNRQINSPIILGFFKNIIVFIHQEFFFSYFSLRKQVADSSEGSSRNVSSAVGAY